MRLGIRNRRFTLFLILLGFALISGSPGTQPAIAQESTPTETLLATLPTMHPPSLTPTVLPSATPTIEPSLTATTSPSETPTEIPIPVPSDTATIVPSAEVTDEPTPIEVTATATNIPTAETTDAPLPTEETAIETASPTLPPEPPLALLVGDTLDTGISDFWTLGAGWSLVASEAGQALQVANGHAPVTSGTNTLFDQVAQLRFRTKATAGATFRLAARASAVGSYDITIDPDGQIVLYRAGAVVQGTLVNLSPDTWHTVRLSAIGGVIRVVLDDIEAITWADAAPLPPGQIMFNVVFPPLPEGGDPTQNTLLVDDLFVWIPATEQPVTTPTATAILEPALTATATAEITVTPTPTALPLEPPLELIFTDNFDMGETLLWTLTGAAGFVPSEGGQALQIETGGKVTFVNPNVNEAAVAARVQVQTGAVRLSLRESTAGRYTATLNADGTVSLYRNNALLGATNIAPLMPDSWYTLRLSAVEEIVRVAVDEVEVIAVQDAAPLPMGTVSFEADGLARVDDFGLWIVVYSQAEPQPTATEEIYEESGSAHFGSMLPAAGRDSVQGLVIQSQSVTFVQDFQGTPLEPGELRAEASVTGSPHAFVGMNCGEPLAQSPSACAEIHNGDPSQMLTVEVTLELGPDWNSQYHIDGWEFDYPYAWMSSGSLFYPGVLEVVLKGVYGDTLYSTTLCEYNQSWDVCDYSIPLSELEQIKQVENVHWITFIHRTQGTVPSPNYYYRLGLDQFRIYAEQSDVSAFPISGRIAFVSDKDDPGNVDIYTMAGTTDLIYRLTDDIYNDISPAISPDGHYVAFASSRTGNFEVYVKPASDLPSNDANLRQITFMGSDARPGGWSPDGTQLIFENLNFGTIYTVDVTDFDNPGVPLQVAVGEGPVWSPINNRILYTKYYGSYLRYIYMRDLDNPQAGEQQITLEEGLDYADPSWSPDGTQIALASDLDGDYDIYVMDAVPGSALQLVSTDSVFDFNTTDDHDPTWSPGGKIGFTSYDHDTGEYDSFNIFAGSGSVISSQTMLQSSAVLAASTWLWERRITIRIEFAQWENTPQPTPTPTPTPTLIAGLPSVCDATIDTQGVPPPQAYIHAAAGYNAPRITLAPTGTMVGVIAKNEVADELWYLIDGFNDNAPYEQGWVVYFLLNLGSSCENASIPIVNDYGQTATPTFTPAPTFTLTPSATYNPQFTPTPTRPAATEAIPFNNQANVFGLPPLFDTFPYAGADENGRLQTYPVNIQGFGPTSFAYANKNLYYQDTSGIHTGLDFGLGNIWVHNTVFSLCDGVIIPSRNGVFNGTLKNGHGISVRCFTSSLTPDATSASLSNIVLVYDHIEDAILVNLYQVVHVGTALGRTGGDPNPDGNQYDHLHLEAFLARGYTRNLGDQAVILNPLILFSEDIAFSIINDNTFYRYYPCVYGTDCTIDNKLGIQLNQLTQWSLGGNNADLMSRYVTPSSNFWAVQTPFVTPTPTATAVPPQVEWPITMYVLDKNDQPLASYDLVNYVFSLYANDPYVAPECTIDNSTSPSIATCDYGTR